MRPAHASRITARLHALAAAGSGVLVLISGAVAAGSSTTRLSNQGPGVSNHPVNVVPSAAITIPAGWPLGPDGSITCRTCHTALPGVSAEPKLRGVEGGGLTSRAFCVNCHGETTAQTAAGMHWLAVPRAHILEDTGRSLSPGGSMDRTSAECLSCHDGVSAPETAYQSGAHFSGDLADPRRNHPVGVRYPRMGTTRTDVPLRPTSMLPPTVQLPGGKVSCISCHDLYNLDPKRLSVPITGSQLCFACHDMR